MDYTGAPWNLLIFPTCFALLFLFFRFWAWAADKLKAAWHRHIVAEFPFPDECFDCHKSDCRGCPVWVELTLNR